MFGFGKNKDKLTRAEKKQLKNQKKEKNFGKLVDKVRDQSEANKKGKK